MKRNNEPNAKRPTPSFAPAPAAVPAGPSSSEQENNYAQTAEELQVEFLTIPGFIRRVPYRFHMEEIHKFGTAVGKSAESLHLCYMTVTDRSLGPLRCFPRPMLERVYSVMAPQMKWPVIVDAELGLPESERTKEVHFNERLAKHLRSVMEVATNAEVQKSAATMVQWLEGEATRLRMLDLSGGAPAPSSGAG